MKKENHNQSFDQKCYQLLKLIPKGKVTTYKEIAKTLGSKAYRAVGNAMRKNPDIPVVPCHRVVCSDGSLGGYVRGVKIKELLLKEEGINIKNEKVTPLKDFIVNSVELKRLF
jgi:methylated-DNA-[protein]-cysteine S-methyltransferase